MKLRTTGRRATALVMALAVLAGACSDSDDALDAADVAPEAPDEAATVAAEPEAGTWKTWVLTAPDQFAVPPPPAPGSPEERAELAEIADFVPRRTPEIVDIVNRWDQNPISTPWVEANLEFVSARAKDPPLSSRGYGLMSVAVADAVVAAWHWKYVYNRAAPTGGERLAEPGPDPSYPSEHAAVAGAAAGVLAYLFPERPALRLQELAEQVADSRVFAGANYRSDVEAGLELGRQVAEAVVAYAKADGAEAPCPVTGPPGPPPRFWSPPPGSVAKPVQPCAGRWKPWVMTSGDQFRPGPPALFGTPEFRAQAEEIVQVQKDLTDDQKRLATFWAGGQGTPLPAGVWNQVALAYLKDLEPNTPRGERALALVNAAMSDAGVAAWDAKFTYWDPRPENGVRDSGVDPQWTPFIETPFFPSYISGHATYSGAAASVLKFLFPDNAADFEAKAQEASNSRLWGGIHWRADNEVGLSVGRKVGDLVVARARSDGAET
ncbi:MAG TPA: phosphatase PAP2 family protein [Acidimicrobiales bacterium]|nr:phosphatase PAP2 family protein [Acidimicrobiales bacterium]